LQDHGTKTIVVSKYTNLVLNIQI